MDWKVYLIIIAALSFLSFLAYAVDKNRAEKGKWRIPEKQLLLQSFLGGAIGGYLAMLLVRHKTRKWYFHAVNLLGLAWQVVVLVVLL